MSTNGYTRAIILDQASELASKFGLARLSAGLVARHITRPKSTVFFHFPTIEQLHLGVRDYAAQELIRQVVRPAYRQPDGLPRLERLVDLWLHWDGRKAYSGGCPFASSAFQFDDQPGPVRNRMVKLFLVWNHMIAGLVRAAVATGTFRPHTARAVRV